MCTYKIKLFHKNYLLNCNYNCMFYKKQEKNFKINTDWEVLTPNGWKDFQGIKKVNKEYSIKIVLENNKEIICSGGHQVYTNRDGEEGFLFADILELTDKILCEDKQFHSIKNIEKNNEKIELYDLVNVDGGYQYYTNGIVSHNCAHIENIDSLWLGLRPTLSTGGSAILISSPSGVGTLFHKIWTSAIEGDGDFHPIELPWNVHPERDQKWFENEKKSIMKAMGERGVAQELLCLDGDTNIITWNGNKKIKEINIGDRVLTHNKNFREVVRVYKHELKLTEEKLYSVTTAKNLNKVLITENHPIYLYKLIIEKENNNISYIKKYINKNNTKPEFISIKELNLWKQENNDDNNLEQIVLGCFISDNFNEIFFNKLDYIKIDNNQILTPIFWNEINVLDYYNNTIPTVWNIEVREHNSYIANKLVVHNCSFAASGDTFIKPEVMDKLYNKCKEPIAEYGLPGSGRQDVWIWQQPKTGHVYVIGCDVSRGDSDDFSAFHVIDTNADEVVAEYKGKILPDKLAELVTDIGYKYNTALICPEKNNVGIACAYRLKDLKYPNLFYEKFQKNMYMVYTAEDVRDETPGIEITVKNRLEIIIKLQTALRTGALKVYSKRLFEELQTYIWKGNKPQAQKGYNDDIISALAITNNLYEAGGKSLQGEGNMAQALLAGMSVTRDTFTPNITSQQDTVNYPPIVTDNQFNKNNLDHNMNILKKKNEAGTDLNNPFWKDFGWVVKD